MAEISKPDFTYQWSSGGSLVAPSNVKIQTGWTAEVPPFQWENWSQNRQDNAILHLFQKGISEWDATSNYYFTASGVRSYVQGSDGNIYVAVQDNVGQNPTTDATDTYWKIAFAAPNQIPFTNMAVYRRIGGVQQVSVNGSAFTTTGATTFIYPASGVVRKRVWGGGGGGGGTSGASAAAAGGNGGGYTEGIAKAAAGTSETVTVGAGGANGAGAGAGGTGGTSIAGSFIATGGGGGTGTNSGAVPANTTTFGIGSGGQFNTSGGGASGSFQASGYIASGGGGAFGSPPTPNTVGLGVTGNFPGGGGSGGSNISNGGSGGEGCIIYEY